MAGENTITTLEKALTKLFSADQTKLELNKNNPTWEKLAKVADFEGNSIEHTVNLSFGQGIGVTIAEANDQRSADEYERFSVPRRVLYGVGSVSGEAIRATKTNKGRVLGAALQDARDNNLENLKLEIRHDLWSNGGGARGKVESISGSTITLTSVDDTQWLGRGMKIVFDDTDGTSGAAKTTVFTIDNVNTETGVVTFTDAVDGGGGNDPAVSDYLFRKGSFGKAFHGIPAWIPKTEALAATTFLGVDRSKDKRLLAGMRIVTVVGSTVQESCLNALERAFRGQVEPDVIVLNPYDWMSLPQVGQQQVQYTRGPGGSREPELVIGFGRRVTINGPYGPVEVSCDPGVDQGDGWLLTNNSWKLRFAGDQFPEILDDDGNKITREANDDAYSWRYGAYGNIVCTAPRKNLYFKVPPRA